MKFVEAMISPTAVGFENPMLWNCVKRARVELGEKSTEQQGSLTRVAL